MSKNKKEYCACGFPQSYPIPHKHDLSDREKRIMEASRKRGALEELNLFKEWLLKDAIPLHMDKPLVILADKSKLQCEENYISDNSIIKQLEKRIKELEGGVKQ